MIESSDLQPVPTPGLRRRAFRTAFVVAAAAACLTLGGCAVGVSASGSLDGAVRAHATDRDDRADAGDPYMTEGAKAESQLHRAEKPH